MLSWTVLFGSFYFFFAQPVVISKILLDTHRQREQELVVENHQLRTILFTLERSLSTEIQFTEDGEHIGQKKVRFLLDLVILCYLFLVADYCC